MIPVKFIKSLGNLIGNIEFLGQNSKDNISENQFRRIVAELKRDAEFIRYSTVADIEKVEVKEITNS